jgi:RNA polymerase sigma factor (sigma-70 family)
LDRRDWLAGEFERQRLHLRAVGYRMLGSVSEAEDAVQETWLRLDRRDPGGQDLRGWLTVVVGRICLDMLRTRRSRREHYAGSWLPEPIVVIDPAEDPEASAVTADSVGLALLIVLDLLSPAERCAFILHDVFGVPFEEVATVIGRSPAAVRQLASRARRRVRAEAPPADADLAVQRRVVDAFLSAARTGDLDGLLAVLDPQVVLRTDGGGRGPLARPPVHGAAAVVGQARIFAGLIGLAQPAIVNGGAGVIIRVPRQTPVVAAFTVAGGRISAIDLIGDPAKLAGLPEDPLSPSLSR